MRDDVDVAKGEYIGGGIPRTAGGIPYDPLKGMPDSDDSFWLSSKPLEEIRRYARSDGLRVNLGLCWPWF